MPLNKRDDFNAIKRMVVVQFEYGLSKRDRHAAVSPKSDQVF
jgi:hypothetical protein